MKNTEQKAMEYVMNYEMNNERSSIDVSKKGCGYDIESKNRYIEVKGFKNVRYPSLSLYKRLPEQLGKKIDRYYIYVVYDLDNSPKLKIIEPSVVKANLEIDTCYIIRGKVYRPIPDEK